MKDEPAIVRELRKEERLGKLSSKSQDIFDVPSFSEDPLDKVPDEIIKNEQHNPARGETIQVNIEMQRRLLEAEEKYEKIFRLSLRQLS